MKALCVILTVAGCGFGAHGSLHQTKFSNLDEPVSFTSQGGVILDKTGILIASAATMNEKETARALAEQKARAEGQSSFTYNYKIHPAVPGNWTYLRYDWGSKETTLSNGIKGELEYQMFDFRMKLGNWKLADGSIRLSLPLGALMIGYEGLTPSGSVDQRYIGMPFGVEASYGVLDKATLTGRVLLDPVVSGIAAAIGSSWLFVESGARFDFRPFNRVSIFADAMLRRAPSLGDDFSFREYQATFGVALIFGDGLFNR